MLLGRLHRGLGHGLGASGEPGILEHAHGSVPKDGLGRGDHLGIAPHGVGPDVETLAVVGNVAGVDPWVHELEHRSALLVDLAGVLEVGDDGVGREQERDAPLRGLGLGRQGRAGVVLLDEALPGLAAVGQLEGVGHGAADEDGVGLLQEPVDDLDLVAHLGPAEDDHERTGRVLQLIAEELQFPLHQEAGRGLAAPGADDAGHAAGRGVGAVRGTEGVVHIHVGQAGEAGGEHRIVGLLLGLESHVLKDQDLPVLQRGDGGLGLLADGLIHEGHRATDHLAELRGHRGQAHRGLPLAVRTAEVGRQDDAGPLGDQQLQGREGLLDAGGVVDHHHPVLLLHRDVVIDAHQDAFAGDVQVADRKFGHKTLDPEPIGGPVSGQGFSGHP